MHLLTNTMWELPNFKATEPSYFFILTDRKIMDSFTVVHICLCTKCNVAASVIYVHLLAQKKKGEINTRKIRSVWLNMIIQQGFDMIV